jgi:prevent-host-death family protein
MHMKKVRTEIGAAEFEARCLQLVDEVASMGGEIVITKRGRPVAKLVPVNNPSPIALFCAMRGSATEPEDTTGPDGTEWGDLS